MFVIRARRQARSACYDRAGTRWWAALGGEVTPVVAEDFERRIGEPDRVLTTMSLGELSGLPSNLSTRGVMVPSCSIRVPRLALCADRGYSDPGLHQIQKWV
jgi:hypothetical protein